VIDFGLIQAVRTTCLQGWHLFFCIQSTEYFSVRKTYAAEDTFLTSSNALVISLRRLHSR
jgi:hypothetical protein